MNTEQYPQELKGFEWLDFPGRHRYIILLFDEKGRPLWAVARDIHAYKEIIDDLLTAPISEFYHLPAFKTLKELCPSEIKSLKDWYMKRFPASGNAYNSKNIAEAENFAPYFYTSIPYTKLFFIPVNPRSYLGIIATNPFIYRLSFIESQNTVIVDDHFKILGYSRLFSQPLKLNKPRDLLGSDLKKILRFNRDPLVSMLETGPPVWESKETWDGGPLRPRFKPKKLENVKMKPIKQGLFWKNNHANQYHYLEWNRAVPVDGYHLEAEVVFFTEGPKVPNIIFRGVRQAEHTYPDILGYSFNNTAGDSRIFLKKNGIKVRSFAPFKPMPGKENHLCIKKYFDTYSFFLNGQQMGSWCETMGAMLPCDDRFYLFIRPGEEMVLKSMSIKSAPFRSKSPEQVQPLTATFFKEQDRPYKVTFSQGIEDWQNFTMFQLGDISYYTEGIENLQRERDKLSSLLRFERSFVGDSLPVREIRQNLGVVTGTDLSVLIEGETGTGKEVLAQLIHEQGPRRNGPFIKIDCSTIPNELIESELFGHEKGAFTGATAQRIGRFEQAQGGTVFLDEIANLPLNIQAKLLSVLEDNIIQRVGGTETIKLEFRLITASNIPLKALISRGIFREDLFYRINQYRFELPPLRDRQEDIPLLVNHFLKEANQSYGKSIIGLSKKALDKLMRARLRGNVRELRNIVMQAVIFCKGKELGPDDFSVEEVQENGKTVPQEEIRPARTRAGGVRTKCTVSKGQLDEVLKKYGGNVSQATRALGISREMVYRLMRRFGIDVIEYRK